MSPEDEVRALEERRYRAVLEGDAASLEPLLHERLAYSHSTGSVEGKAELLAKLRSGRYDYQTVEHAIDDVVVVGLTALVLHRMRADVLVDGQLLYLSARSLAVWVREGAWELLAYQPTPDTIA